MKLLPFSKGLFKNFKSSLIEEVLPKDHIKVLMALEKNYNLCFTINYLINSWNLCLNFPSLLFNCWSIYYQGTVTSWSKGNIASTCSSVK